MKHMRLRQVTCVACAVALACSLTACGSGNEDTVESVEGLDELGEVTVVAREEGSGTRSVFSGDVGLIETDESGEEVDVTTESATICNDAEAVIEAVSSDEAAIGYVSLGALDDSSGVKVIAVDGVEPSTDTVKDNSYPLSRDFYIAYVGETTAVEADFLDYILSEGQDIVGESYVPVNSTTRFLSDESSGTISISGSTSVAPLMEDLADAYEELNPNATISIVSTDSTTGLNAAMTQGNDWGMSSRDLEEYEQEILTYESIAQDAVAVIVNEDNPAESLTTEQLRQLFAGEAVEWADVNG